jgi:hypothetical protein
MRSLKRHLWGILVLTLMLASGRAGADELPDDALAMPLPDFQLTRLDQTVVSSRDVRSDGKWLLIYTKANCGACEGLLGLVDKNDDPDLPSKIVVVVSGADVDKVTEMAAKFPDLGDAARYADPGREGRRKLKARGMPIAYGLRGDSIQWCTLGVLDGDSAKMKSILSSWIVQ